MKRKIKLQVARSFYIASQDLKLMQAAVRKEGISQAEFIRQAIRERATKRLSEQR